MRIIAGTKRGMKLSSPKNYDSRPILDRVKESLFSVLNKYDLLEAGLVADLFSGVGSLGLEALSRGAGFVTFVDRDSKVIPVLKANIERAGFVERSKIIRTNAFRVGPGLEEKQYSIVFVDPPYPTTENVMEGSELSGLLKVLPAALIDDGIVVVRTHKCVDILPRYGRLEMIERRTWGNMAIAILGLAKDDE